MTIQCLCLKSSNTHRTALYQQRAWNACLCLWCRTVPHICETQLHKPHMFWPYIHCWEWPQTPCKDQAEEHGRCTRLPTEEAALPTELWYHQQVQPCLGNAGSRWLLPLCTTWCPRDNSWHCHKTSTHHPTEGGSSSQLSPMTLSCTPLQTQSLLDGQRTKLIFHTPFAHNMTTVDYDIILCGKALIIPSAKR